MDTPWVCNGCKSINRPSADKCYSCRAPRAIAVSAGFNPAALAAAGAGAHTAGAPATAFVRTGDVVAPLWTPGAGPIPAPVRELFSTYRSANLAAWLAIIFIALATAGSIASFFHTADILNPDGPQPALEVVANMRRILYSPVLGFYLAYAAISIAAAIFFLVWVWRSTKNVPALGGGWPATSGLGLIGWWFVPIGNLFRPARFVEDLRRRSSVPGAAGAGLLAAWWLTWVGAQVLPNIGGYFFGFFVTNVSEALRLQIVLSAVSTVLYCAAAFFVVLLIRDIQHSQEVRAAAIVADGAAQPERPRPAVVPLFVGAMVIVVASSALGLILTRI